MATKGPETGCEEAREAQVKRAVSEGAQAGPVGKVGVPQAVEAERGCGLTVG